MRIDRLQQRFLVAMGLSASVIACSKEKGGETPPTTPSQTASTTTAPLASASATADASGASGRPPFGGGGCGFVIVCNPSAATAPKNAASKPFERCAAKIAEGDSEGGAHGEGTLDEELTAERRKTTPGTCCYKPPRRLCGGGRPLRGDDGPIVASAVRREDWIAREVAGNVAADAVLSAQWLREAAMEHASVASFARVSLQLLALGAPSELIAGAHAAALDEIEHARTCYALAARRGSVTNGPGPLAIDRASFALTMEAFVRDTFLDGCVAETLAALDVRARAGDGDDTERAALTGIADDEDRHAELAWRMLAWGVREGGPSARAALQDAMRELEGSDDPVMATLVLPCARALLLDTAPPAPAPAAQLV